MDRALTRLHARVPTACAGKLAAQVTDGSLDPVTAAEELVHV